MSYVTVSLDLTSWLEPTVMVQGQGPVKHCHRHPQHSAAKMLIIITWSIVFFPVLQDVAWQKDVLSDDVDGFRVRSIVQQRLNLT